MLPPPWPRWLADAPLPPWTEPRWLRRVPTPRTRDGRSIDEQARARLLLALEHGGENLARFEVWLEPTGLREHAWALVEAWAGHGSDPRHRWVLAGLRLVSDDELEERLVPSRDPETKGASVVLQRELARLERALSTGRDWSVADWRHWLLEHRLMRHVVPTLVWAQRTRDDPAQLSRTFRVDFDGVFTDVESRPLSLDPRERVCLLHPVELTAEEHAAWGELVAELELIPPFAQLGRIVHQADPADVRGDTLREFPTSRLSATTLRAELRQRGWSPGEPDVRMRVSYFAKPFVRFSTYGVLTLDSGLPHVGDGDGERHRVSSAFFLERAPGGLSFDSVPRIPLSDVTPIALSEVLYDLAAIAG